MTQRQSFPCLRFWLFPHLRNSKRGENRAECSLSLKFRGPAVSLVLSMVPKAHLHTWGLCPLQSSHHRAPHSPQTLPSDSLLMTLEGQQEKASSPDPKTAPSLDTPSRSWAKLSWAFFISLLWHPSDGRGSTASLELTCHELNVHFSRLQLSVLP